MFEAQDLLIKCGQGGVAYCPQFPLQGWVRYTNLQHHADEVVTSDIHAISLLEQGQELLAKLDGGLPFLLPSIEEMLAANMDRVRLKEGIV